MSTTKISKTLKSDKRKRQPETIPDEKEKEKKVQRDSIGGSSINPSYPDDDTDDSLLYPPTAISTSTTSTTSTAHILYSTQEMLNKNPDMPWHNPKTISYTTPQILTDAEKEGIPIDEAPFDDEDIVTDEDNTESENDHSAGQGQAPSM